MSLIINLLYGVCVLLLVWMALLAPKRKPGSALHQNFALTCVSLVVWLLTLYVMVRSNDRPELTLIGRANFTSVLAAVTFSFLFVTDLAGRQLTRRTLQIVSLQSLVLAGVTLLTPLIDRQEIVVGSEHVTIIGPLFALFALHVTAYPIGAGVVALKAYHRARSHLRDQLLLVGLGILVTAAVNIVTGLILPYGWGIFAFEELGALSSVAFAGAVCYAIVVERMLDIRIIIRKTIVLAVLLAIIEQIYTEGIKLVVESLPGGEPSAAERQAVSLATVMLIAGSFAPIKKWLEKQVDKLLFRRGKHR